jgi:hypothetical protein
MHLRGAGGGTYLFASGAFPQNRLDFERSYVDTERNKTRFTILNFSPWNYKKITCVYLSFLFATLG